MDSVQNILQAFREKRLSRDQVRALLAGSDAEERAADARPRDAEARVESAAEPIAIIGLSAEFPGVQTLEELWTVVRERRVCIEELPEGRYPGLGASVDVPLRAGLLANREHFDPRFFGISPREAEAMNPSQRLVMQHGWRALEDAGYAATDFGGRACGAFIGCEPSGYIGDSFTGASEAIVASRLSYYLNWRGPALVVNTGCSSSAVALHLACESLRRAECELALAGGVFAHIPGALYRTLLDVGMLSSSGQCRPLDARADGTVFSEAVGLVVLKRLSDAQRDSDPIWGIIRGSGINQDGRSNGITAPNGEAQEALIAEVYRRFDVDARRVGYFEAHGTGTQLGDPIEFNAASRAFRALSVESGSCALGTVKANLGHTGAAAGVVGLIKLLLAMRHGELPAQANFAERNELLELANSPFFIAERVQPWPRRDGSPRLAALSSFGHSGTNVHLVVEEHAQEPLQESTRDEHRQEALIFPLSARTEQSLQERVEQLRAQLVAGAEVHRLVDIAYTLAVGRVHMEERVAFLAHDRAELTKLLSDYLGGADSSGSVVRASVRAAAYGDEAELRELVAYWVERGKQRELARAWADGVELPWSQLLEGRGGRRVRLPSYPFRKERHWLGAESSSSPEELRAPKECHSQHDRAASSGLPRTLRLVPDWVVERVAPDAIALSRVGRTLVVCVDETLRQSLLRSFAGAEVLSLAALRDESALTSALDALREIEHCVFAASSRDEAADAAVFTELEDGVLLLFRLVKALLAAGYGDRPLLFTLLTQQALSVHRSDPLFATHASIHGLGGSLVKEYPQWSVRMVDVERGEPCDVQRMLALPLNHPSAFCVRRGEWFKRRWVRLDADLAPHKPPRRGGVYVVIGGAGGIGRIWSAHVAKELGAQVVWVGRRPRDAAIERALVEAGGEGPRPVYLSADACDRAALEHVRREVLARFGRIDGLVLAAVSTLDQGIEAMSFAHFREGLRAKVDVSVRAAQVFADDGLEFVLVFSSIAAFLREHGKASYAAGTAFQDEFVRALAGRLRCAVKVINWGYWGEVGVGGAVPDSAKARMSRQGIGALPRAQALAALDALLSSELTQLAVLALDKPLVVEGVELRSALYAPARRVPSVARGLRDIDPKKEEAERLASDCMSQDDALQQALARLLGATLVHLDGIAPARASFPSFYADWQRASLELLVSEGLLQREGSDFRPVAGVLGDLASEWARFDQRKAAWQRHPQHRALVCLAEATLRALPEILTGKLSATQVIFPEASLELVEAVYRGTPIADFFNERLADVVVRYLAERRATDKDATFRLLEIGAGTGGTTALLLPRLQPHAERLERYDYTDLSKAFLLHGEQRYGQLPYFRTARFDVTQGPAGQGFEEGTYDLVIATNVLHATHDIRQTLRHAKSLLAEGGVLVLNEMSRNTIAAHVTLGLLEGWWRIEDAALRIPGSPALTAQAWCDVLEDQGFREVACPLAGAHGLGHQIIVAESDGLHERELERDVVTEQTDQTKQTPQRARGAAPQAGMGVRSAAEVGDRELVRTYLAEAIGRVLKMPLDQLADGEPLANYGLDSILIGQLRRELKRKFGEVEATLLFEHNTIGGLVAHVVDSLPDWVQLLRATSVVAGALEPASDDARAGSRSVHGGTSTIESRLAASGDATSREPIAIIGMSARLPGARDLDEFWSNLLAGRHCVGEIPADRWALDGFFDPERERAIKAGKSYCRHGAFIDGFAEFDPLFFRISPREALDIDPQERLFLQCSWSALEDAGYSLASLHARSSGKVGVFAGVTRTGFDLHGPALWRAGKTNYPHTSFASVANRVSYLFDLRGPSLPIDTMCSSSLVAVHEACEQIRRGSCEVALVGGVNLYLHPSSYVGLCALRMLASDGRCKSFGAGDGFVPGEGVAVIVLKPLAKALADGDNIRALIRGSSVNHGGKTNGYTVPNPAAQREVVSRALAEAQVDARHVSYIEAHGTGTELGDPIEIRGLSLAFREHTSDRQFCALGSVKSGIGHLEAAAGIAGLIKVVLQLQHRQIAPTLHAEVLNPGIDFESTPFVVQRQASPWQRPTLQSEGGTRELPLIAGVSSFGAGGSNAHVLLEEYAMDEQTVQPRLAVQETVLIVLSARDGARLLERMEQLLAKLEREPSVRGSLRDLAYTLQVGREAMEERVALVVSSLEELRCRLKDKLAARAVHELWCGRAVQVAAGPTYEVAGTAGLAGPLRRSALGKVAEAWVAGAQVDWEQLDEGARRRVNLPTYPFAREQYWYGDSSATERTPAATAGADASTTSSLLRCEERWEAETFKSWPTAGAPSTILHFAASEQEATALAQALSASGADSCLHTILAGEEPGVALARLDARACAVVYGWARGRGVDGIASVQEFLLRLREQLRAPITLLLLGRFGGVEGCYDQSWIGFSRSLGIVTPELSVSLLYADTVFEPKQLLTALAYPAIRRVASGRLERLSYRLRADDEAPSSPLRRGGTYLVTGGCGGLGQIFAQRLGRACGANVVLLGRSESDPSVEEKLAEIRRSGAQSASYRAIDVCDESAVAQLISEVQARFGAVHGIVHAAGLAPSRPYYEKSWHEVAQNLRAKIDGTLVLDRCTASSELDFFCLFSSTAAMLGDLGACDYAVANRFQVAFAEHRARMSGRPGKTLAVCWPYWRAGGMGAVGSEGAELYLRASGQRYLERDEGTDVWLRMLAGARTVEAVFAGDRERCEQFLRRVYQLEPSPTATPQATLTTSALSSTVRSAQADDGVEAWVSSALVELVAEVVNVPPARLDVERNLADFGFDSIKLTELARSIGAHFGVRVAASIFFTHGTIRALAGFLLEQHGSALAAQRLRTSEAPLPAATRSAEERASHAAACDVPWRGAGEDREEPIAVVGIAGQFSGAANVDELWSMLRAGEQAITPVPAQRWDVGELFVRGREDNEVASDRGGFIADVDAFDPRFFELTPREAGLMDPRQRLLLQQAWHALEDAGYRAGALRGSSVGVFVGVEEGEYATLAGNHAATGTHNGVLAARISYFLDFHGPNLAVNTACSSGLVALHYACESLRRGECELALVGAANVLLSSLIYRGLTKMGMLSPDGCCRAFDHRANGLVPGEAVAAIVLKPLSRARADGDPIRAVIRATGINHDGRSNGLTAPNGRAQRELLENVHARAAVSPDDVGYVLAHGTGTALGDPVEANVLIDFFRARVAPGSRIALGSTKTNLGHTFAASGIVSLIAMVRALEARSIPPLVNYEAANPAIEFSEGPLYVNQTARDWPQAPVRARAGAISAFGMSGTNAHVVLEEYVSSARHEHGSTVPTVLPLSAKSAERLVDYARLLRAYIEANLQRAGDGIFVADLAHTFRVGREPMQTRAAFVVRDVHELLQGLTDFLAEQPKESRPAPIVAASLREDPEAVAARAVAERFCSGEQVDWSELSAEAGTRRVSAPGYPFARRRCWFDEKYIEQASRERTVTDDSRGRPVAGSSVTHAEQQPRVRLREHRPVDAVSPVRTLDKVRLQSVHEAPLPKGKTGESSMPPRQPSPVRLPLHEDVVGQLRSLLAQVLYVEEDALLAEAKFLDLGVDSITGVEWIKSINRQFSTNLTVARLYDRPTLSELARLVTEQLAQSAQAHATTDGFLSVEAERGRKSTPVVEHECVGASAAAHTRLAAVRKELARLLSEVLYVAASELRDDVKFLDMGVDSIVGVEWVKQVNRHFQCGLSVSRLYDHPTLSELARFVDGALAKRSPAAPASRERVLETIARATHQEPTREDRLAGADDDDRIAIIGIAGRYPGARELNRYWQNLCDGIDSVRVVPGTRWNVAAFTEPGADGQHKVSGKWLGALDAIEEFDPLFFQLSPLEAECMDPQQRLFMQEAWSALESAGYAKRSSSGLRCGTYVGIVGNEYGGMLAKLPSYRWLSQALTGNTNSILSARLAYALNLRGPALAVDTACSSSLVATHLACNALLNDELDLALVGGVSLYLTVEPFIQMSQAGMLSTQGHCAPFAQSADGIVPGEGVGVLVLKKLSAALRDRDYVHGIILGTAINQDGRTNGITAPSVEAQAQLIGGLYERKAIDPRTIGYVEAHGTGTRLGDPIEVEALASVFGGADGVRASCALGSVKSNLGHTSAAAGIAAIHKVLLCMRHGKLVPTLHFDQPNEHIDFAHSPFFVNTRVSEWKANELAPRRAAVSSFGISGTNAHLVLEEFTSTGGPTLASGPVLLPLSARSAERLREYAAALAKHIDEALAEGAAISLSDLAYTYQTGRESMDCRVAFVGEEPPALVAALHAFAQGEPLRSGCLFRPGGGEGAPLRRLFSVDELRSAVARWAEQGAIAKIAEAWAQGLEVDWALLYGATQPRRVPAPTYPFARERCWFEAVDAARDVADLPSAAAQPERAGSTMPTATTVACYREAWVATPLQDGERDHVEQLVLIGGSSAERDALTRQLREQLARARVTVIDEAVALPSQLATVNDGRALAVVYLLAEGAEPEALRGLYEFVRQSLLDRIPIASLLLAGSYGEGPAGCLAQALIGIERSLRSLLPEARVAVVLGEPGREGEAKLVSELGSRGVVRYRRGERERLTYEHTARAPVGETLRFGGRYLITGGTGGLGRMLGEHLASRYGATLLLTGRAARSDELTAWLTRLELLGAHAVRYYSADASDAPAIAAVIRDAEREFGGLDGVFHLAGVEPKRRVHERTWAQNLLCLAPKITGTQIIDQQTAHLTLDFMCFFSSSAGVLGDFGACDYAAGNRFQMAYAEYRNDLRRGGERRGKTLALCWPYWRAGGMGGSDPAATSVLLASSGQRPLEAEEGLRLLGELLDGDAGSTLVLAGQPDDLERLLARAYQKTAESASKQASSTEPLERRVSEAILDTLSRLLKLPRARLDPARSLSEFGVDSIVITQLAKELGSEFGCKIAPALLFGSGTGEKLAELLCSERRAELEQFFARRVAASQPAPQREPQPRLREPSVSAVREPPASEPIAVIGMAVRCAGADDICALWRLIEEGRSRVREVPSQRWNWRDYFTAPHSPGNQVATNRGAFLTDVHRFDPLFFEIAPREAKSMGAKQRLFLQEAWHAFEDAGYAGQRLRGGSCGVFVGVEDGELPHEGDREKLGTGLHNGMLAARVSYLLDLHGANLALNASCASGLVAVHQACSALLRGECEFALAGAVSVIHGPAMYEMLSELGVLSPEGCCRPYDRDASGLVPGEAVAALVLKPLSRALRDGDPIWATIRATFVNYDGKTAGISAPSASTQRALYEGVIARAGVEPSSIEYAMGHSVGSALGDPVELDALARSLKSGAGKPCALGSIKPLIGHTFAASGIVNVIATCLAMRRGVVPAAHGFVHGNPHVDWTSLPLRVRAENEPWPRGAEPRRALVAATGMSGTNAAAVLEEFHEPAAVAGSQEVLVPLSAKSPAALRAYARELALWLEERPDADLLRVAFTMQTGREQMKNRQVFVARRADELAKLLRSFAESEPSSTQASLGAVPSSEYEREQLARFMRGEHVDWATLYGADLPRKVSLPAYPFVASSAAVDKGKNGNGASSVRRSKRICVIGAGPSGLITAKSLLEEGHEPVVFERQERLGGIWNVHEGKSAGAYRGTVFQTSRYTSVFSDFIPEDMRRTFYTVDDVQRYLQRFAERYDLPRHIRYATEVLGIEHVGAGAWRVRMRQGESTRTETFDGVAMCQGMFWKPFTPNLPGAERFKGQVLHAGQYLDNQLFAGKRVLVIGNGVSGMDIAAEAAQSAERVLWSFRTPRLILPRMVGFVPNDCQSMASLLSQTSRWDQLERVRAALPEYYERCKRARLLPTAEQFERRPIVQVNDTVVAAVESGRVQTRAGIKTFTEDGCIFQGSSRAEPVDIVVYCTGYKLREVDFLGGIALPSDFSLGIFYAQDPTLVNVQGSVPIVFGSFYHSEMTARWYARQLSGYDMLTSGEQAARVKAQDRAVTGPVSALMFGLRLGLFPDPRTEFAEFWRLLNLPCFPMLFRLRGPHADPAAAHHLENFAKRAYVRGPGQDPTLVDLRRRILAGFESHELAALVASAQISEEDWREAEQRRGDALRLEWDLQFVRRPSGDPRVNRKSPLARELTPAPMEGGGLAAPTVFAATGNGHVDLESSLSLK